MEATLPVKDQFVPPRFASQSKFSISYHISQIALQSVHFPLPRNGWQKQAFCLPACFSSAPSLCFAIQFAGWWSLPWMDED